mmetsp:Transcript_91731/g.145079  ORF Transcript_91731/g.145079 Transcript_91731/m.145079 type:complete len:131 (+) Transcript_91731:62-454(+)
MYRAVISIVIALHAAQVEAAPQFLGFADVSDASAMHSVEVLKERIRDYKAINPLFSEESCTTMFETKLKLGSAVPPADFVLGCDKVCASAKGIKEYWGSGDMASYACEVVSSYGCVWDGTPPVKPADIGC